MYVVKEGGREGGRGEILKSFVKEGGREGIGGRDFEEFVYVVKEREREGGNRGKRFLRM